jgi:hypothetical protein
MATVWVRIVILTLRITLAVCSFNRMAHTANTQSVIVNEHWKEKNSVPCVGLELDSVVATVAVVLLEMIWPRIR